VERVAPYCHQLETHSVIIRALASGIPYHSVADSSLEGPCSNKKTAGKV